MIRISRTRALLAAAALGAAVAMACPAPALAANTQSMWRLYNPNSGEHFYTASTSERDYLASLGWHKEGLGWTAPASSNTPVYRLYNPYAGDHHYTSSASERDWLVSLGWSYEGIGWYSDDAHGVPLYRQYNPYAAAGSHNYTTSRSENDYLASIGWHAEGIGWYGIGASGDSSAKSDGTGSRGGGSAGKSSRGNGQGGSSSGRPGTGGSGWTAPESSYTLYYDGNGATGGSTPESGMARASANGFVKSTPHGDAPFLGWNTRRDGSGTWVQPGHAAPSGGTLYAQWDSWVDTSSGAWDETVTDKAAWDEEVPVEGAAERRVPDVRGISGPNYTRNGQKSDDGATVSWDGDDLCIRDGYLIVWRTDKSDAEAAAEAYRRQGVYYWNGGKASGAADLQLTEVVPYSKGELVSMGEKSAKSVYQAGQTLTLWRDDAWEEYETWADYQAEVTPNELVQEGLLVAMKGHHANSTSSIGIILTYPPETRTIHHDAVTHIVHHEGQASGHWRTRG